MAQHDHPEGTARMLPVPVRLPNGAVASAELWYGGQWVAAGPVFGDLQPITSADGPTPETDPDDPAPAWFYQLEQGK